MSDEDSQWVVPANSEEIVKSLRDTEGLRERRRNMAEYWENEYMTHQHISPTPVDYLRRRASGQSVQEIAEAWGYATRDSVYLRLKKWESDGSLAAAEDAHKTISELGSYRDPAQTKYKKGNE